MGTSYETLYEQFLFKVKAYNLLAVELDDRIVMLKMYLNTAIARFFKLCYTDLTKRNDEEGYFENILAPDEEDILTDLMVIAWLSPQIYSDELLESRLNTKDFTEYSPSKLIDSIRTVYDTTTNRVRQAMIDYSYSHRDVGDISK